MYPIKYLSKPLLAASVASALALASVTVIAQQENPAQLKTYTDPVSGELKIAPKLLSQMTKEEKAALTEDEIKELKKIESLVKKEHEMKK